MRGIVETVTREQLKQRRARLLRRSGLSWRDMQLRAKTYSLNDEQRSLYDTIRGIDWMLKGQR